VIIRHKKKGKSERRFRRKEERRKLGPTSPSSHRRGVSIVIRDQHIQTFQKGGRGDGKKEKKTSLSWARCRGKEDSPLLSGQKREGYEKRWGGEREREEQSSAISPGGRLDFRPCTGKAAEKRQKRTEREEKKGWRSGIFSLPSRQKKKKEGADPILENARAGKVARRGKKKRGEVGKRGGLRNSSACRRGEGEKERASIRYGR